MEIAYDSDDSDNLSPLQGSSDDEHFDTFIEPMSRRRSKSLVIAHSSGSHGSRVPSRPDLIHSIKPVFLKDVEKKNSFSYIEGFKQTERVEKIHDDNGKKRINQYIVLELIGKGAYGKVKKVLDTKENTYYAVKILNKKQLQRKRIGRTGNALQEVQKEIAIWKKLNHHNIVRLHEVIDSPDSPKLYMISELVEGGSILGDKINNEPLHRKEAKNYFTQLILHRDIKPGNLLLTKDGVVKIADFGVSTIFEDENDVLRNTTGTGPFLAPEMMTGKSFRGKPVDVYACGITLFVFTYGRPPIVAETIQELYTKIQNEEIEYEETVNGRIVDPNLIDLMKRILVKNPEERCSLEDIIIHPYMKEPFNELYSPREFRKIEVTKEDIQNAITPLLFYQAAAAVKAVKKLSKNAMR